MPTWHSGQAWRVVNSLNKLNEQIRAYAPRSVPPATDPNSWGSIADDAHSMSSDHYPHFYSALGGTAVVCARDFPHAPKLGLDGGVVTEHLRQARDSRVQYIIFNRRITGVNYGWQWRQYTGTDPHDTHFHVSTVHDSRADGAQAWSLPNSTGAPAPEVDDDEMGASFAPIEIKAEGFTSLCLPPVGGGDADPRLAWLTVCNDVFDAKEYALRLWWSKGDGAWAPITGDEGLIKLTSGTAFGSPLPTGLRVLSVLRMAVAGDGSIVESTSDLPAYGGHLTLCIERGKALK
jgi:hypothetical protein